MLSSGDTLLYSFEDNECDSETTEFYLMGERERNQIEAKFKNLTNKIPQTNTLDQIPQTNTLDQNLGQKPWTNTLDQIH